jgi:hypothetical protein
MRFITEEIVMNEMLSSVKTDLIFDIEPKTADFIRERYHGDVTVAMDFEPMMDSG